MGFYEYRATRIDGADQRMDAYVGQVVVVVNTASKCGFTPQFGELEALYKRYQGEGLMILGFPCNHLQSRTRNHEDIASFVIYLWVTFPMLPKIEVMGEYPSLYRFLKKEAKGTLGNTIKWNFTKFLIGRDGKVLKRFAPNVRPMEMEAAIVEALKAPYEQ